MELFLRVSLCFSMLVGCAIGVGYGQPEWIADLGLDFWKIPELNLRINEEIERGKDLDKQISTLLDQYQYKARLVEDLIDGKIPLAEAAVLVQEVTSLKMMEIIIGEEEMKKNPLNYNAARMLIYWVGQELKWNSPQREAVCSRLETEFKEAESLWN